MTTAGTMQRPRALLVRTAVIPCLIVGLGCAAVGAATTGQASLWGALVGTGLVIGFFWIGQATLRAVRAAAPALFLVIALMTYTLQVIALFAVFAAFGRNDNWSARVSTTAIGISVIMCTGVWTVGLVVASTRERIALYDVEGTTT